LSTGRNGRAVSGLSTSQLLAFIFLLHPNPTADAAKNGGFLHWPVSTLVTATKSEHLVKMKSLRPAIVLLLAAFVALFSSSTLLLGGSHVPSGSSRRGGEQQQHQQPSHSAARQHAQLKHLRAQIQVKVSCPSAAHE
jgi:hypothetical protein